MKTLKHLVITLLLPIATILFYSGTPPGAGNCLKFDGMDNYVKINDPADASLDMGTNNFTIEAWVNSNMSGVNGLMAMKSYRASTSNGATGWALFLDAKNSPIGHFSFLISDEGEGGSMTGGNSSSAGYNDGKWHHIAVVVNRNTNATFYVDGLFNGSFDITNENGNISNPYPFLIGINYNTGNYSSIPFDGSIDEVRIWNKALSQTEIRNNMCQKLKGTETGLVGYWRMDEGVGNTAYDSSDNGNDGTLQ